VAPEEAADVGEGADRDEVEGPGECRHGLCDGFDASVVAGGIRGREVGCEAAVGGDALVEAAAGKGEHRPGQDGDVGVPGALEHLADKPGADLDPPHDSGNADEVDIRVADGAEECDRVVNVGADVGVEPDSWHGLGVRQGAAGSSRRGGFRGKNLRAGRDSGEDTSRDGTHML
jgi:hypothetical protein